MATARRWPVVRKAVELRPIDPDLRMPARAKILPRQGPALECLPTTPEHSLAASPLFVPQPAFPQPRATQVRAICCSTTPAIEPPPPLGLLPPSARSLRQVRC